MMGSLPREMKVEASFNNNKIVILSLLIVILFLSRVIGRIVLMELGCIWVKSMLYIME